MSTKTKIRPRKLWNVCGYFSRIAACVVMIKKSSRDHVGVPCDDSKSSCEHVGVRTVMIRKVAAITYMCPSLQTKIRPRKEFFKARNENLTQWKVHAIYGTCTHKKIQTLTTRNRLYSSILTDFQKYTFSDGHLTMMMQCDVTGGGPMEASVVLKSLDIIKSLNIKKKFYSLWLSVAL